MSSFYPLFAIRISFLYIPALPYPFCSLSYFFSSPVITSSIFHSPFSLLFYTLINKTKVTRGVHYNLLLFSARSLSLSLSLYIYIYIYIILVLPHPPLTFFPLVLRVYDRGTMPLEVYPRVLHSATGHTCKNWPIRCSFYTCTILYSLSIYLSIYLYIYLYIYIYIYIIHVIFLF